MPKRRMTSKAVLGILTLAPESEKPKMPTHWLFVTAFWMRRMFGYLTMHKPHVCVRA